MQRDNEGIIVEPCPRCRHCGGEGPVRHEALRDPMFGTPGSWSLRQCANPSCGLGWLDPQPLVAEIPKLYASYYTHADGGEPAAQSYHSGGLKGRLKRLLGNLLFWKKPVFHTDLLHLQGKAPGRLLDVGCGDGVFLAAAAREGWQALGLDFDEKAVAAAKRLPGVDARVGDLFDQGFAAGSFDAIVMNNVIEHLPEPARVFAECHRLLAKGGRLVMITPNVDALGHEVFGRHWRGLEPPRHLQIFNARTLRAFAGAAGFRTIHAFSSIGHGMFEMSRDLAAAAGVTVPDADPKRLRRRAMLQNLLGRSRGEWVVLVAER